MSTTQCQLVVNYIKEFGSISTREAFLDIAVTRLASRIHDLKQQGYEFETQIEKSINRFGKPVHYTVYSFAEEQRDLFNV